MDGPLLIATVQRSSTELSYILLSGQEARLIRFKLDLHKQVLPRD